MVDREFLIQNLKKLDQVFYISNLIYRRKSRSSDVDRNPFAWMLAQIYSASCRRTVPFELSVPLAPFLVFKMLAACCSCISEQHLILIQHFTIVLLDVFLQASLKTYIGSSTCSECPCLTPPLSTTAILWKMMLSKVLFHCITHYLLKQDLAILYLTLSNKSKVQCLVTRSWPGW